jgi:hypothetical protein
VDNAYVREFPPQTLDKVDRLLDLLEEMDQHPGLRGKLVLHGGTAINLFMLGVPRLSVDIDVSYVGAVAREAMLAERPTIERSIEEVARSQGYSVSGDKGGHAGRTFTLTYRSQWGPDHVKVDCIYMNRLPLSPVQSRTSPVRPGLGVPMFSDAELAGGKVKAFYDRVKVRDLYDVSNLGQVIAGWPDKERMRAHEVILWYASLSASFPFGFEGRTGRFAGRERDLEEQLWPMLRLDAGRPTMDALVARADTFVRDLVLPRTDAEQDYLDRFASGDYQPQLLFDDKAMARSALESPEAQWKLRNLRQMP